MEYDLTNAIHEICESHGFSSKIESVAIDVMFYLYVITRNGMTVPDSELPGLREHEDSIGYSEPHGFSIMEFLEKNNFCGLERSAENKYALIEYEKMSYGDIEGASEIIEEF